MLRLSVASQLLSPGLVMMFTPASPIVPTAGSEKHAGLKNRGAGTFDLGLQPDTTLMRAPSDADPVISSEGDVEKPGVNGPPVENVVTPDSAQWSITAATARLFNALPSFGKS